MSTARANGVLLSADCGYRFGDFEYDPIRRALRRHGIRVALQRQPRAILLALLESPGKVVTREELRMRLWGGHTFVKFEQGLNSAIKRLRDALCDSADNPNFVETVPGEGYRFIGQVERFTSAALSPIPIRTAVEGLALQHSAALRWWSLRNWPIWIAVGGAVIALVGAVWTWKPSHGKSVQLGANNWILVTRFDNRTGDGDLDNVLDFALQSDLSNSRVAHIVSPERIQDTLQMMRKPPNTPIDEGTGREICLRDGGIRALISGRVEKLGGGYVLTASVADAQTGERLWSVSSEVRSEKEILRGVAHLSDQLRQNMGEALGEISKSNQEPEKVTTSSLRAAQLLSAGSALLVQGKNKSATELFSQAIELDPEFASAYVYRGWAMEPQNVIGRERADAIGSFRRAMELADKTSERERLFIMQSWYGLQLEQGDLDRATQYGRRLTTLYPDFYWGVATQAELLMNANRPDEAAAMFEQGLRLRPNAFDLASVAWQSFSWGWQKRFHGNRPDLARVFGDKAERIAIQTGDPSLIAYDVPFIEAARKSEIYDMAGTAAALETARPLDGGQVHGLIVGYLSLGKLHKAEEMMPSGIERAQLEMIDTFLRDGVVGLHSYARRHPASKLLPGGMINLLYARVGGLGIGDPAVQQFVKLSHAGGGKAWLAAIEGEEAVSRKQFAAAIPKLREALEWPNSASQQMFMADSLAIAFEHRGDWKKAAAALEWFAGPNGELLNLEVFRPLVLEHLARIYRHEGDARAREVEDRVRKLLALADADYSLDAQLAGSLVADRYQASARPQ